LLAGSTPFDAKELMASGIDAMRKTIREKEPVRPSTKLASLKGEALSTTAKRRSAEAPKLLHQLRGDLDWIVMKCLEKDRTRRYESANAVATDNLLPTLIKADPQATKRGRAEAPDESVGQTLSRYKLLEGAGAGGCGVGVCRGSSSFTW